MARPVQRKDHPLSMRLADADIAIIDRAAILRGRFHAEELNHISVTRTFFRACIKIKTIATRSAKRGRL